MNFRCGQRPATEGGTQDPVIPGCGVRWSSGCTQVLFTHGVAYRGGRFKRLRQEIKIYSLVSVLGRFPAKLGPKTPLNRSGSTNGVECTKNQHRRPILIPSRGGRFEDLTNMCFSRRPGPREPPKWAGNGGPGPPRHRRTVLGNPWVSKSGWGTGWAPSGCPCQNAYSQTKVPPKA